MQALGNTCGCGRMIFSLEDIAFSNPEDPKVTFVIRKLKLGTCIVGCGKRLLIGTGDWRFQPVTPTSVQGKEMLREAVKEVLDKLREPAPKKVEEPAEAKTE